MKHSRLMTWLQGGSTFMLKPLFVLSPLGRRWLVPFISLLLPPYSPLVNPSTCQPKEVTWRKDAIHGKVMKWEWEREYGQGSIDTGQREHAARARAIANKRRVSQVLLDMGSNERSALSKIPRLVSLSWAAPFHLCCATQGSQVYWHFCQTGGNWPANFI